MHDPMTVAFNVRRPWPRLTPKGSHDRRIYGRFDWPSIATIWHVDPERDGTDDSCGWSRPKLTEAQTSELHFFAGCEARDPWLLTVRGKRPTSAADAEVLLRGAILLVADRLDDEVSLDEATRWAIRLLHNPVDNLRSSLCFLPGWHSNNEVDREHDRRIAAYDLFCCIAQFILRARRPWYRHARWHMHHWKIQIHIVLTFKRWLFSRCSRCGGRFAWGYSPTSGSWNGTGPRWFRGEPDVYHGDCSRPNSECVASEVKPA